MKATIYGGVDSSASKIIAAKKKQQQATSGVKSDKNASLNSQTSQEQLTQFSTDTLSILKEQGIISSLKAVELANQTFKENAIHSEPSQYSVINQVFKKLKKWSKATKDQIELAKTETQKVITFVKQLEGDPAAIGIRETAGKTQQTTIQEPSVADVVPRNALETDETGFTTPPPDEDIINQLPEGFVATFGVSEEEYNNTQTSQNIQYESGITEDGIPYAIMTGISLDLAEKLRKEAKPGKNKKPKKGDLEKKLRELENKTNKTPEDYEKLIGYRYMVDNWDQMTKSGGKKKLSKSNLKQLAKLDGDDTFISFQDVEVSKTKKKNYHRKNVIGTVAAAVVGTVATIFTAGALGTVAAAALGSALGSITGDVIEGKSFKEVIKNAALSAAIGAASGAAGKAVSGIGKNITNEGLRRITQNTVQGAARSAVTGTLNDLADDGKINSMDEIALQTLAGGLSGGASAALSNSTGEFGDTFVGNSLERGVQKGMQNTIIQLTDGDKNFSWTELAGNIAGGMVEGAAEQAFNSVLDNWVENPNDRPWIQSLVTGVASFSATALGELLEGAIKGEINDLEILAASLGSMQATAVSEYEKAYAEKIIKLIQNNENCTVEEFDQQLRQAIANKDRVAAKFLLENRAALISAADPNRDYYLNTVMNGVDSIKDAKKSQEQPTSQPNSDINPETSTSLHNALNTTETTEDNEADLEEELELNDSGNVEETQYRNQYDELSFSDAFAQAMRDFIATGQCVIAANGKCSFVWHGKEYALEYADGRPAIPNQPVSNVSENGHNVQHNSDPFSQFNPVGSPTSISTPSDNKTVDQLINSSNTVSKSTNIASEYSRDMKVGNRLSRMSNHAGAVGDVLSLYKGINELMDGDYTNGLRDTAKGGLGLGTYAARKTIPGMSLSFGAWDAYNDYQKEQYLRSGLNLLSGVAGEFKGIGTLVSLGTDGIIWALDEWWY